jgi:hypothetical protein
MMKVTSELLRQLERNQESVERYCASGNGGLVYDMPRAGQMSIEPWQGEVVWIRAEHRGRLDGNLTYYFVQWAESGCFYFAIEGDFVWLDESADVLQRRERKPTRGERRAAKKADAAKQSKKEVA